MAPTSTAVFRAVADFASLNREVRKTRREIEQLQAQAGKTGGWTSFDNALKKSADTQAKLRKETDALAASQGKLSKSGSGLTQLRSSLDKLGTAQRNLKKDTDALASSQEKLGKSSGLSSLTLNLDKLSKAQSTLRKETEELSRSQEKLGKSGGLSQLTESVGKLSKAQQGLKRDTDALSTAQTKLGKSSGLSTLTSALDKLGTAQRNLKKDTDALASAQEKLGKSSGLASLASSLDKLANAQAKLRTQTDGLARSQSQLGKNHSMVSMATAVRKLESDQSKLKTGTDDLLKAQAKLGKSHGLQAFQTKITALGDAQSKLRKETDALVASQSKLGRSSGLSSLTSAMDKLAEAQDKVRTSANVLSAAQQTNQNRYSQIRSEVGSLSTAVRGLSGAEEAATRRAQDHAKALADERNVASGKTNVLNKLSDALHKTAARDRDAASSAKMHAESLDRERVAATSAASSMDEHGNAVRNAASAAKQAGTDHDAFTAALRRVADSSVTSTTTLRGHSSSMIGAGQAAARAGSDHNTFGSAVSRAGSAAGSAAGSVGTLGSATNRAGSQARGGHSAFQMLGYALGSIAPNARQSASGLGVLGAAINPLRSGMRALGTLGQGVKIALLGLAVPAVVSGVQLLGGSISALIGALTALVGAATPAVGALAALGPAAIAGAGAIGTVVLAFRGVGDALKAMSKLDKEAGASGADTARQRQAQAKAIGAAQRGVRDAVQGQQDAEREGAKQVADAQRNLDRARRDASEAAVAANRRVADANDDLVRANQRVLRAEEELHDARRQAIRDLEDLEERVTDNALSQEGAEIRLLRAQERLNEVNADYKSTMLDRREAALAVREAEDNLSDVQRQSTRDASDLNDARRAGVNGMPGVVSAQESLSSALDAQRQAARNVSDAQAEAARSQRDSAERVADAERALTEAREDSARRQRDASERVADAMERLTEAQQDTAGSAKGASAAARDLADALDKLSPKGRALVDLLRSLQPKLDEMSKAAQEAFLPGVINGINTLTPMIDNVLIPSISAIGTALSGVTERLATEVASWSGDLLKFGANDAPVILSKFGDALILLASAAEEVGVAAVPLLAWFADLALELGNYANDAAEAGRQSGALVDFFDDVKRVLGLLGNIIYNVSGQIRSLFQAGAPEGERLLGVFEDLTQRTNDWMKTTEGKNRLREYFEKTGKNAELILGLLGDITVAFLKMGESDTLTALLEAINVDLKPKIGEFFSKLGESMKETGPQLIHLLGTLLDIINNLMGSGVGGGFSTFISVLQTFADVLKFLTEIPGVSQFASALLAIAGGMAAIKAVGNIGKGIGQLTGLSKLNNLAGGKEAWKDRAATDGKGTKGAPKTAWGGFGAGLSGGAKGPAQTGTARVGQKVGEKVRGGVAAAGGAAAGLFNSRYQTKPYKAPETPIRNPGAPAAQITAGPAKKALPAGGGAGKPQLPAGGLGTITPDPPKKTYTPPKVVDGKVTSVKAPNMLAPSRTFRVEPERKQIGAAPTRKQIEAPPRAIGASPQRPQVAPTPSPKQIGAAPTRKQIEAAPPRKQIEAPKATAAPKPYTAPAPFSGKTSASPSPFQPKPTTPPKATGGSTPQARFIGASPVAPVSRPSGGAGFRQPPTVQAFSGGAAKPVSLPGSAPTRITQFAPAAAPAAPAKPAIPFGFQSSKPAKAPKPTSAPQNFKPGFQSARPAAAPKPTSPPANFKTGFQSAAKAPQVVPPKPVKAPPTIPPKAAKAPPTTPPKPVRVTVEPPKPVKVPVEQPKPTAATKGSTAPASAPKLAGAAPSTPAARPTPVAPSGPAPQPKPTKPAPEPKAPAPKAEPAPRPGAAPTAAPKPAPVPKPAPDPKPAPAPRTTGAAAPTPAPQPRPTSAPAAAPKAAPAAPAAPVKAAVAPPTIAPKPAVAPPTKPPTPAKAPPTTPPKSATAPPTKPPAPVKVTVEPPKPVKVPVAPAAGGAAAPAPQKAGVGVAPAAAAKPATTAISPASPIKAAPAPAAPAAAPAAVAPAQPGRVAKAASAVGRGAAAAGGMAAGIGGSIAGGMAGQALGQKIGGDTGGQVGAIAGSVAGGMAPDVLAAGFQKLQPLMEKTKAGLSTMASTLSGAVSGAARAAAGALSGAVGKAAEVVGAVGRAAGAYVKLGIEAALSGAKQAASFVAAKAGALGGLIVQLGQAAAAYLRLGIQAALSAAKQLAVNAAAMIVRGGMLLWAAAQWVLNAAMNANPIGLIILAIMALVAALVYAWNNSETFRAIVIAMWEGIKSAFFTAIAFIQGIWSAFWGFLTTAASAAWNGIVAFFTGAFAFFSSLFSSVWNGILSVWNIVWGAISSTATAVWNAISSFFMGAFTFFQGVFTTVWNTVLSIFSNVWNGIKNAAMSIWNAISLYFTIAWSAYKAMWSAILNFLSTFFTNIWNGIKNFAISLWNSISAYFTAAWAAWRSMFEGVLNFIRSIWDGMWNFLKSVGERAWTWIRDGIGSALDAIKAGFQKAVDWIREQWARIQRIVAEPVNFVIREVYNNGIKALWDKVAGWLNLPGLPPVNEVRWGQAEGGAVPITGDKRQGGHNRRGGGKIAGSVHGRDSVPILAQPGEYMLSAKAVQRLGGTDAVDGLHRAAKQNRAYGLSPSEVRAVNRPETSKERAQFFAGGPVRLEMATGGAVWQQLAALAQQAVPGTRLTDGYSPRPGYHGRGKAVDLAGPRSMDMPHMLRLNKWIASNYGPTSAELIHTQPGAVNLYKGKPHTYNSATQAGHRNHVHWAMDNAPGGPSGSVDGGDFSMQDPINKLIKDIVNGIVDPIRGMIDGGINAVMPGPDQGFKQGAKAAGRKPLDEVVGWIFRKADEMFPPIFGGGGEVDITGISGPVVEQVRQVAAKYGWDKGPEWDAIVKIVQKESSWDPTAANKTTSARGLFQKMTSLHGPVEPTPAGQAAWALNYIKGRYGTPTKAWAFHQANGSYATGGLIPGSGNEDNYPAMLMPGEFVIRKQAVEAIGLNNLQKLNGMRGTGGTDNDAVQRMALGGVVQRNGGPAYQIKRGDTLARIARDYGTTVAELQRMNKIANANKIYAGSWLSLPKTAGGAAAAGAGSARYQIKKGDTLWTLARRFGTTVGELQRLNNIRDPNKIYAGAWLNYPVKGAAKPATPAPAPKPTAPAVPAPTALEQYGAGIAANTKEVREFESNLLTLTRWGYGDLALALQKMGMKSSGTTEGQADTTGGLALSREAIKSPANAKKVNDIIKDSQDVLGENLANVLEIVSALQKTPGLGIREVSTATEIDTKDIFKVLKKGTALSEIKKLPAANNAKFLSNFDAYQKGLPFSTGGPVWGTGNKDTVPAMLTPGEFVLRKSAAQKIGIQNLSVLNHADALPTQKFADGGPVLNAASLFGFSPTPSVSVPGLGSGVQTSLASAVSAGDSTTNSSSVVFGEGSVQINNPAPQRATDSFSGVMTKLGWAGTFS